MWYRRTLPLSVAVVLSMVLVSVPHIEAVTIENVTFADSYHTGRTTLVLHGAGVLRRFVWKGYAAALYLEEGAAPETVLSDTPKRLELEYFRSIKGPDFGEAADEVLAKNFPEEVIAPLRERLDRINRFYRDLRAHLRAPPGNRTLLQRQAAGPDRRRRFRLRVFRHLAGPKPDRQGPEETADTERLVSPGTTAFFLLASRTVTRGSLGLGNVSRWKIKTGKEGRAL
jgi:hypothetical protein